VYPALAVLQTIRDSAGAEDEFQPLWVGGVGGMEAELVNRQDIRFEAIPAAGVHGVGWRALPGNLWQLGRGFLASRGVLRKFRPDVLFFTGGYVAVPMALAARLTRTERHKVKSLLYVPDIEPGLALKTIARFADHIAVTTEDSKPFFTMPRSERRSERRGGGPAVTVTGYPLRPGLEAWSKAQARQVFALREDLPVLLVFGGSKGARSINQALVTALPELLKDMQVLHISGQLDWREMEKARGKLTAGQASRYRLYPYLHKEMGAAFRVADLAVTRAGASTLGELPLFRLPAILVPYPYAWRYQKVNAHYLAERGAAVMVEDAELKDKMASLVCDLMADRDRRQAMQQALEALACPEAAAKIVALLKSLAGMPSDKGSTPSDSVNAAAAAHEAAVDQSRI
jgi:UDP-N-acetylglucosamine--N-acetylmuramyl-(pentapeptide) pyrophosphoryl-undecaprenol N-acetylglucosamine transferase